MLCLIKKRETPRNHLDNAFQIPLPLLCAVEHLLALGGEVGTAAVAGDVFEEDGLEGLTGALALAGLFALRLLELELDVGGLAVLLGVDGVGDARPEAQRLVGRLLVLGGYDLGSDVEGRGIDDDVLVFRGDVFLDRVSLGS